MSYQVISKTGSSAGASEKSHNVYSRNYKIGVILQKEIQCLNVEEKNTACSIAVDQRILTTRFRNKLNRSFELMKRHDKIRSRFVHVELRPNRDKKSRQLKREQTMKQQCNSHESNRPMRDKQENTHSSDFDMKTFYDSNLRKNRPQTALECKTKEWKRNADNAKERVVRSKSASPGSWRNCDEIMNILDTGKNRHNKTERSQRPLSRARFFEAFDLESFRDFRAKEVEKQNEDVRLLIESLQPLKLEPWFPRPAQIKRNGHGSDAKLKKSKSTFVTRVDSFMQ